MPLEPIEGVDFAVDDAGFTPAVAGPDFEAAVLASARLDARLRGARLGRAEFEIALVLVAQFAFAETAAELAARDGATQDRVLDFMKNGKTATSNARRVSTWSSAGGLMLPTRSAATSRGGGDASSAASAEGTNTQPSTAGGGGNNAGGGGLGGEGVFESRLDALMRTDEFEREVRVAMDVSHPSTRRENQGV